jgi:hypothetical protein
LERLTHRPEHPTEGASGLHDPAKRRRKVRNTRHGFAPLALPAPAAAQDHAAYLASVATYKPMAGFSHVVGNKRFVGYFLAVPDLCRVTVFEAIADDVAVIVPPKRFEIDVKAADRAELDAGEGAALAIACTVDADAIKIAPQLPAAVGVRLDHPSD